MSPRTRTAIVAALSVSAWPVRASAEDAVSVSWAAEVPVALAAGATGIALHLMREELVSDRCAPNCDGDRVNAFDATTLGSYSEAANDAGNALVTVSVALGPTIALLGALGHNQPARWRWFAEDTLILAETMAFSVLTHQVITFASQRPRPYAYARQLRAGLADEANTYLSFYSGHTANAFAAATATSYLFTRRYPSSRWTPAVWALTHGLATIQGYTRVVSGYHFWTDAIVGALMGSAMGIAVPALHDKSVNDLGWMLIPMPHDDGFALGMGIAL